MTLATCSGARGPLLSQSWSKSKGGMFEILHLLFWKNVRRHGKNWSNTIKYIWKSSSGSELYRGFSFFVPRRQENIKKQYGNKVEKWRVSEARPLILPSWRTDGPTDRPTDGRTDIPSYRDARTHLKSGELKNGGKMKKIDKNHDIIKWPGGHHPYHFFPISIFLSVAQTVFLDYFCGWCCSIDITHFTTP